MSKLPEVHPEDVRAYSSVELPKKLWARLDVIVAIRSRVVPTSRREVMEQFLSGDVEGWLEGLSPAEREHAEELEREAIQKIRAEHAQKAELTQRKPRSKK